jgi:hypothetical protein
MVESVILSSSWSSQGSDSIQYSWLITTLQNVIRDAFLSWHRVIVEYRIPSIRLIRLKRLLYSYS